MQKKILPLAIAAAMVVPMAAQADVTIYGKMDISYNFVDHDSPAGVDGDFQDISSNSSRLGFKGSEDLGGGLKAIWQMETEVEVDSTTAPFNRNTWVGLAGDWGQVRMGRHDTPFKIVGRKADFFESRQLGENRILVAPGMGGLGWDVRASETIAYISPDFNGFHAAIAYVPEGIANGADDGDAWSMMGLYNNGPLMVGAGYETHNDALSGGDAEDAFRLVGSYKFGDFTVGGMWQDMEDQGPGDVDSNVWGLGGSYVFGNNKLKLQYYDREDELAGGDADADFWAIGLDHNFSKRTKVYFNYAAVENDNGLAYSINSPGFDGGAGNSDAGGALPTAGGDSSGFAIGVNHNF